MADLNIRIGDLRDRITFQAPTIAKKDSGAQTEVYANIATNPTVWAQWVNDHGQEVVTSDVEKSEQRATITIRYRSDVSEKWQVLKGGEAWKIFSIDHVRGRNRWTVIRVERVKGSVQ
jgi:SPP1 family predicted phage head-tail adaptor